ncbi:uncharacterized protein LOC143022096 isoform X2 [Oratosquilla oratoria]|uniref:uncharacterized protein LOC143022096 isoform X2 n=1 Tax=Oratosquilla oratoria TaxID=337810 RepID=UPI003F775F83
MIVMVVVKKFKSFFILLLNLLKRCFCCFRKRRHSDTPLPVTSSGGEETSNGAQKEEGWDWDVPSAVVSDGARGQCGAAKLSPLEQQIQAYRLSQQRKIQEQEAEPEPEPDYFQDIAPSIEKKQQVLILERPEEEQQVSNRLSFSLSDPILQSGDLGEWLEEGEGWEEEAQDNADIDAVLREKRQQEREKRRREQLRRKAEKDAARFSKPGTSKLATKLS